jgi:hypothetical protein
MLVLSRQFASSVLFSHEHAFASIHLNTCYPFHHFASSSLCQSVDFRRLRPRIGSEVVVEGNPLQAIPGPAQRPVQEQQQQYWRWSQHWLRRPAPSRGAVRAMAPAAGMDSGRTRSSPEVGENGGPGPTGPRSSALRQTAEENPAEEGDMVQARREVRRQGCGASTIFEAFRVGEALPQREARPNDPNRTVRRRESFQIPSLGRGGRVEAVDASSLYRVELGLFFSVTRGSVIGVK